MTNLDSTKAAIAAAKTRMEKAVDDFRKELTSVRTGRANAAILENVRVDYHGTPMPVNQLGNLTVPDASMLMITPWDPSVVPLIDKAIRASDLGLNPTNDGKVVRIPIPSPTGERRKELVKQIHKALENHRTAVRNIRRDIKEAIDKLEKDKKISQDDQKRSLDELEKLSHAENQKNRRPFRHQRTRSYGTVAAAVIERVGGISLAPTELGFFFFCSQPLRAGLSSAAPRALWPGQIDKTKATDGEIATIVLRLPAALTASTRASAPDHSEPLAKMRCNPGRGL